LEGLGFCYEILNCGHGSSCAEKVSDPTDQLLEHSGRVARNPI
jgi:hypothetical protein